MLNEIEYADATPSLSQAQRLRIFSWQGRFNADVVYAVMSEEKSESDGTNPLPKRGDTKVFPKNYTGKDMQSTILKLLDKRQQQRGR